MNALQVKETICSMLVYDTIITNYKSSKRETYSSHVIRLPLLPPSTLGKKTSTKKRACNAGTPFAHRSQALQGPRAALGQAGDTLIHLHRLGTAHGPTLSNDCHESCIVLSQFMFDVSNTFQTTFKCCVLISLCYSKGIFSGTTPFPLALPWQLSHRPHHADLKHYIGKIRFRAVRLRFGSRCTASPGQLGYQSHLELLNKNQ